MGVVTGVKRSRGSGGGRPSGRFWIRASWSHWRFQRTPSLVSSRIMPWAARLARISSARAKLRAFLAAVRSRDQRLRFRHRIVRGAGRGGGFQYVENAIEAVEECEGAGAVAGKELAGIHGGVGVANIFEHGGQGFGGIEIVVQGFVESLEARPPCGPTSSGFRPSANFAGFQAQFVVAQTVDGSCGGFQAVEGEVQLLAIGHRREQVADRLPARSPCARIAQGVEIAQRFRHLLAVDDQDARSAASSGRTACR